MYAAAHSHQPVIRPHIIFIVFIAFFGSERHTGPGFEKYLVCLVVDDLYVKPLTHLQLETRFRGQNYLDSI